MPIIIKSRGSGSMQSTEKKNKKFRGQPLLLLYTHKPEMTYVY